jgi:DNA-binding PadR family transcriptional regulator
MMPMNHSDGREQAAQNERSHRAEPVRLELLGLIFIQPATGYDLKRRFATTSTGVYQPSSGALYPALDRLERRGLLASEAPPADGGRLRRRPSPRTSACTCCAS